MKSCNNSTNIFQEAIGHCRWKNALHYVLAKINIVDYKNKTFEEIIVDVYNICNSVKGVGMLAIYDISSGICRYYNKNIDKVYIVGNGPKRAVKILNIKTKTYNFNDKIKLNYVEINDVVDAFDMNNYVVDENIRNTQNGDILESYICYWQKTK